MNTTALTLNHFCLYGLIGFSLAIVYLFLLWQTICILNNTKKKALIQFISSALRIFLLIFVALVFAKQNLSYFLIIACSFLITRMFLLKIFKPTLKKKITTSEILYADTKKQPTSKKITKRKRR